tara:strand:+ start:75 stop:959 length:885 start_codon:yes stop_codon:yes gene_type:complete
MIKKIFILLFFPFIINAQVAFISGNDTICENSNPAIVKIDFFGTPPFTFLHEINGVSQTTIITQNSSYFINTKTAGTYTLNQFYDAISFGTISGSAVVTVLESPTSVIHLLSDTLSVVYPAANFRSNSIGDIISWNWIFGDNTINESSENPKHIFPINSEGFGVPNSYQSALIIVDAKGCSDTAIHQVWVQEEYWLYIPTSFTPDNDKLNDKFCIEYHAIRENTFLFKVYNSQGDLMFQSISPQELKCSMYGGWDGTHYKSKKDIPSETYVYELYFQDFEGWKHKEYGSIQLLR